MSAADSVAHIGADAYAEVCQRHGVKPNKVVLEQLSSCSVAGLVARRVLDCSNTFVGVKGALALLDFLEYHQNIHSLIIPGNGIDAQFISMLSELLPKHTSLQRLNISGNPLSTPSGRALWELAKNCHTLAYLNLSETTLKDEWVSRIAKTVNDNAELIEKGFITEEVPRHSFEWRTAYLGVIITPDPEMVVMSDAFITEVLPTINLLLSERRVRVTAIRIDAKNTQETQEKLRFCADPANYDKPWVVTFLGKTLDAATKAVLTDLALGKRVAAPPPLRDKFGNTRAPIRQEFNNIFCYKVFAVPRDEYGMPNPEEKAREEFFAALRSDSSAGCFEYKPEDTSGLRLRVLTDLYACLAGVHHPPKEDSGDVAMLRYKDVMRVAVEEMAPLGEHRTRELSELLKYCRHAAAGAAAYPMLLYGGAGIGRSAILAAMCKELQAAPDMRVVPFFVQYATPRLVPFCCYMTQALSPSTSYDAPVSTLEELLLRVREAISSIPKDGNTTTVVVVAGVEALDNAAKMDMSAYTAAQWLPTSFPSHVRVVLSVSTNAPALAQLRQRQPQPYETLATAFPRESLFQCVANKAQERGCTLLGFQEASSAVLSSEGVVTAPKTAAQALLLKEDSDLALFGPLAAAVMIDKGAHNATSEAEVIEFINNTVPDTCGGIFTELVARLEKTHGVPLVRDTLLVVAHSSSSLVDAVECLEGTLGHKRYSALPLLLALRERGILFFSHDGSPRVAHHMLNKAIALRYPADTLDAQLQALARRYLDDVRARSVSFRQSFVYTVPLLLSVGQAQVAADLMSDASVLNDLLHKTPEIRPLIYDALFRIVHTVDTLELVGMEGFGSRQFRPHPARRQMVRILKDLQQMPDGVLQASSALAPDAPLRRSMLSTVQASKGKGKRLLVWRNNLRADTHSSARATLPSPVHHVSCSKDGKFFSAVTADGTVQVFSSPNAAPVATKTFPGVTILAAHFFAAAPEGLLCVAEEDLIVWDFSAQKSNDGTVPERRVTPWTASLSSTCVHPEGRVAVVVNSDARTVGLLDLMKGKTLSVLPTPPSLDGGMIREARYAGTNVAVCYEYDIALHREGIPEPLVLAHEQRIVCLAETKDGTFIATGSDALLSVWETETGSRLHICRGHAAPVVSACFHPNGSVVASCSMDGTVRVWLTLTGVQHVCLRSDAAPPSSAQFSDDGTKLVVVNDHALNFWDGTSYVDLGVAAGHNGEIRSMFVTNACVVSGCEAGDLRVWGMQQVYPSFRQTSEAPVATSLSTHSRASLNGIKGVQLSMNRATVAVLTAAKELSVWETTGSGSLLWSYTNVDAVAYFGNIVVACCPGSLVVFEDPSAPVVIELPPQPDSSVWSLSVDSRSAAGPYAACSVLAGKGARIMVFDLEKHELVTQFSGHSQPICASIFHDKCLITASFDNTIKLWSLETHAERASWAHPTQIAACAATATQVVVGDADGSLHFLRLERNAFVSVRCIPCGGMQGVRQVLSVMPGVLGLVEGSGSVALWDTTDGNVGRATTFTPMRPVAHATCASVSGTVATKGKGTGGSILMAIGTAHGEVLLLDVAQ